MGRKQKYSKEIKLLAIQQYNDGLKPIYEIARELNVAFTTVKAWMRNYEINGEAAFEHKKRNKSYTFDFKMNVINSYLAGEGSYEDVAFKYKIPSRETVRLWILKYNRDTEIKEYNPKGYVYMAKNRKVSYEEKLEIVEWTIKNNLEYKLAAEKFETSYIQVYNWVKKYNKSGEQGLVDNRGKRIFEENLTELEILKREIEFLKRKNERLEMEQEVIKKFQEIERRDQLTKSVKKPNIKR